MRVAEFTRILIVDDSVLIRDGLSLLLRQLPDVEVFAHDYDSREVVQKALGFKPHVILINGVLPSTSGFEVVREIMTLLPETHCLMLGASESQVSVERSRAYGLKGFFLKTTNQIELQQGIQVIMNGGEVFPASSVLDQDESHLSPRERQVLKLLVNGYKSREIAEVLYISVRTVEKHRASLSVKVDIHNPCVLVDAARKEGFLE